MQRSVSWLAAAMAMVLPALVGVAFGADAAPLEEKLETLDLKNFDHSTAIVNKWLPMTPGMRYVYKGTTVEDDGAVVPHRIEINITDLIKVISGIPTVVSYDLDYSDGELVEAELAFYAQDNDGNVWRFGEYPEEYEDGKLIAAPSWIHGFEDARAGIMMKAEPKLGTPSYAQGWGPAVDWTDRGITHQMGQKTTVPTGSYEDVLVIKETSRSEVDAGQLKYYAPGVGNVRVGWGGAGEKTQETLELVKIEKMDAKALAKVRAKALKLEKSAYKNSKKVYAHTAPATAPATARAALMRQPKGQLAKARVKAPKLEKSASKNRNVYSHTAPAKLKGQPKGG